MVFFAYNLESIIDFANATKIGFDLMRPIRFRLHVAWFFNINEIKTLFVLLFVCFVPSCDFISHSVSKSVGCVSQWPSDQTRTSIGAEFAEEEKQEAKALQIPANCLPSICQILNPRANT